MITVFDWLRWALAAEIRSPSGMAAWVKLVTLPLCFDIETSGSTPGGSEDAVPACQFAVPIATNLATRPSAKGVQTDSSLTVHAKFSSIVCALSALALAGAVGFKDERRRFWAFCLFEACVGMYYPVQGMLRGTLISNEHRATVSLTQLAITT